MGSNAGQTTVEYLLVGLVLMIVISAFGVLVHAGRDGRLAQIATQSLSHNTESGGGAFDVVMY